MDSICKHCGERITLIGLRWHHLKTDRRQCEAPSLAEPPSDLAVLVDSPTAAYEKGFRDGRKAAEDQEKRSYNWNKQYQPLSASSVALLQEMLTHRPVDMKRIGSVCESPMEELFAVAIVFGSGLQFDEQTNSWLGERLLMQAQMWIEDHRVDFLFNQSVVVEIDGHEFHDRTAEQASGDRARDRDLVRAGYFVLRFTGSDIYRNAISCAQEVEKFCRTKCTH